MPKPKKKKAPPKKAPAKRKAPPKKPDAKKKAPLKKPVAKKRQPAKKKAAPLKKRPVKKKAVKQKAPAKPSGTYVLAPGGFRRIELISKARKKKGVHTVDFSKFRVTPTYTARMRGERLESAEDFLESMGPPTADTLNANWVAYAAWKKADGNPVVRFEATYTVPEVPPDHLQVIFLFIGLQNNLHILQPVLQYGKSGAGGGAYWAISSFFAGGQADNAQYSNLAAVDAGQTLKAVIEGTAAGNGNLDYVCYFEGFDETKLSVPGVPELTYCCGTLESYHIHGPGDYPPTFTTLGGINLSDATGGIDVPWQLSPNPGTLGEHAVLDRQAGQPDQIELHFSNT